MYRELIAVLLCLGCQSTESGFLSREHSIMKDANQELGFEKPTPIENIIFPKDPRRTSQAMNASRTHPRVQRATEPEYCLPLNESTPDFNRPGLRLSEVKCQEYFWALNLRLEKRRRRNDCLRYRSKKNNMYPTTIRGMITGPGDYPHMGAIGWKATIGTWVFKCGSSLISEKFVMTAAHCTRESPLDPTVADPVPKIVRLGDKNIIDVVYILPPTDAKIINIIVHPQYSRPKKYFDIALMELENDIAFSKSLHPACLWTSFDNSGLGKEVSLTGWGVVESGSLQISPELMTATVDIMSSQTCDGLLRKYWSRNWWGLQDHQICARKLTEGVDSCQGDSGGPLQAKIPQRSTAEGQMHYVFGIISFGVGCARPKSPGIYTRVASFIDWIEDNVWRNG